MERKDRRKGNLIKPRGASPAWLFSGGTRQVLAFLVSTPILGRSKQSLGFMQSWAQRILGKAQPLPGPPHPPREQFLPYIQPKFPLFQFEPILSCPVTPVPVDVSLSGFPVAPAGPGRCSKVSTQPPQSQGTCLVGHPQSPRSLQGKSTWPRPWGHRTRHSKALPRPGALL